MEILDRPNGKPLHQHLEETFEKAKLIYKQLGFKDKNLFKIIKYSSILHDIGKATKEWQKHIGRYPHSLFSAQFIYEIKEFLPENLFPVILRIVAEHHSAWYQRISNGKIERKYEKYDGKEIKFIYDTQLSNILERHLDLDKELLPEEVTIYLDDLYKEIERVSENSEFKKLYTYALGILKESDYKEVSPLLKKDSYPYEKFNFNLKLSPLQEEIYKEQKYKIFLIIAPTGIGKTEASLVYAKKFDKRRLFYTIPISFAINVMKDRLSNYFPKHSVDIYHHWSHIFRALTGEEEIFESSIFSKRFFNAVNIIAPDHIVLTLLKSGDWIPRLMSIYNSTIIFDECHLYDPYFFWFNILSLEKLFEITSNVNVIFMSATAPKFLYDILKQKFGEIGYIFKKEWYDTRRDLFHIGELKEGIFSVFSGYVKEKDIVDLAIKKAKEGKKVLIVRNSVKKAQELYEKFRSKGKEEKIKLKIKINAENEHNIEVVYRVIEKIPILLAHRRYTFGDRFAREKLMQEWDKSKKGWILIATQIVEVSLDIDFDVLISDVAPIPALVQRLGRINRKRNKENTEFYIIELEKNHYWKPYMKFDIDISKEILENFIRDNLSIKDSEWLSLVEKYYNLMKEEFISTTYKGIQPSEKIKEWIDQWINNLYPHGPIYLSESELKPLEIIHGRPLLEEFLFANIYQDKIEKLKEKISEARKQGNEKEAFKYFSLLGMYTLPVPIYLLKDEEFKQNIKGNIYIPYNKEFGLLKYEENFEII